MPDPMQASRHAAPLLPPEWGNPTPVNGFRAPGDSVEDRDQRRARRTVCSAPANRHLRCVPRAAARKGDPPSSSRTEGRTDMLVGRRRRQLRPRAAVGGFAV